MLLSYGRAFVLPLAVRETYGNEKNAVMRNNRTSSHLSHNLLTQDKSPHRGKGRRWPPTQSQAKENKPASIQSDW
jgi:hypothetical protein